MNPYLKIKRDQYDKLRATIEGLQTRAAEANRDLSEDELRSVQEQGQQAKKLADEIESLTEIEHRNAKVAKLANQVLEDTDDDEDDDGGEGSQQARSRRRSTTTTRDRDPGHYTRSAKNSFFADLYRARGGDEDSARRLTEHNRALSTGTHGPGVVPPKWLTSEFELIARQGRGLAKAVRNIPLGDDPRPITLPKQVAGTDTVVAEQPAENTPVAGGDAWDTDVDTVVPKPTAGKQLVSRQMVDMSDPAVDLLIYGDLMSVYDAKVEAKVCGAVLAAAGAPVTTFATGADFELTGAATDAVIDLAVAVRTSRKLPADLLAMPVARYGEFLKLKDTTGRPLIPLETAGPMNVVGVGSVAVDGRIHGLGVVATDGLGTGFPESFAALRASDTVLFESNILRFRFEEQAGPESVVLGIWGYTAVIVRQQGRSVKRAQVTAP